MVAPHSPHDALVKLTFSDLASARGELRAVIPPEVGALVDWSSLAIVEGTFIDATLSARLTDRLFSVRIAGREARIYMLLEHQSTRDVLMPYRMLRYQVRIWDQWLRANPDADTLPPILAVLLAQVVGGWKTSTRMADVYDFANEAERDTLMRWLPQLTMLVDDLASLSEEALAERDLPETARLALAVLQHARRRTTLERLMRRLERWIRELPPTPTSEEMMTTMLAYLGAVRKDAEAEQIEQAVANVGPEAEDRVMTTLAQLKQKGIEQGIDIGSRRARGAVLENQLVRRFQRLSPAARARIAAADEPTLDRWLERVLTEPSVDDVLAD